MKIRILTIVGCVVGLIVVLASMIRWLFIYNDPSQAILGMSIGAIGLGASYIYQRLSDLSKDIKDLNNGLDGLNIWTRDELEKLQKGVGVY